VGNRGVIGPGDIQWMSAARGIVHEEYHSTEFSKSGGTFEVFLFAFVNDIIILRICIGLLVKSCETN
jgi:hypothetical protein